MTALNKQAHQTENERMAQSLAERNGEPVEGLRQRISELEEISTDYGMKFQKAQDALKHQALLHKSQLEAAENSLIDSECHVAELEEALRDKQALLEAEEKRIAEQREIVAAAEKLVRCKGRYHSELNYLALAKLFGVTTPDLPPLEHENVHYADAAEMEIAALRQRIAELQIARDKCFLSGLKTGWEYGIADDTEGYNREIDDAQAVIDRAAGIGVKGE